MYLGLKQYLTQGRPQTTWKDSQGKQKINGNDVEDKAEKAMEMEIIQETWGSTEGKVTLQNHMTINSKLRLEIAFML